MPWSAVQKIINEFVNRGYPNHALIALAMIVAGGLGCVYIYVAFN